MRLGTAGHVPPPVPLPWSQRGQSIPLPVTLPWGQGMNVSPPMLLLWGHKGLSYERAFILIFTLRYFRCKYLKEAKLILKPKLLSNDKPPPENMPGKDFFKSYLIPAMDFNQNFIVFVFCRINYGRNRSKALPVCIKLRGCLQ